MTDRLFSDYILPSTLAFITLGMGISLKMQDFRNVMVYPKGIIVGLSSQMILLPCIALIIAALSDLPPEFKAGLLLISACPGGTASNLVTYLLGGALALSISMTALNSLLILGTIPLILNFALSEFMNAAQLIPPPVYKIVSNIFYVILVPVLVGVSIRENYPVLAGKLQKPLKYIMPTVLALVFLGVIFLERESGDTRIRDYMDVVLYALILNLAAMSGGLLMARLFSLSIKFQFTIAIEVGLQNSALAIFIAKTLLDNQKMAVVAVVYSSFTFFTTALFGYLAKTVLSNRRWMISKLIGRIR